MKQKVQIQQQLQRKKNLGPQQDLKTSKKKQDQQDQQDL